MYSNNQDRISTSSDELTLKTEIISIYIVWNIFHTHSEDILLFIIVIWITIENSYLNNNCFYAIENKQVSAILSRSKQIIVDVALQNKTVRRKKNVDMHAKFV